MLMMIGNTICGKLKGASFLGMTRAWIAKSLEGFVAEIQELKSKN